MYVFDVGVEKKRLKAPTKSRLRKTLLTLRFDFFTSFFLLLRRRAGLKAAGRSGRSSRNVTLCEDHARGALKRVVTRRSRLSRSDPLRGSCESSAQTCGETSIACVPEQPYAGMVRVDA